MPIRPHVLNPSIATEPTWKWAALTLAAASMLSACGGGGTSSPAPPGAAAAPPPAVTTTVSGSAVKGPLNGATVTLKKPDGTDCGSTTTTATGTYSLSTACTGDLLVEVTGGSYLDEATNTTKALTTPLKVMVSASGGPVVGVATPLTTLAYSTAFASSSAASRAAFDTQAARIATQFGLGNVNLATSVPVLSGAADAYGNALRAISQYLKENSGKTLATITTASFTNQADLTAFSTAYTTAYRNINGSTVSVSFDGAAFNIAGTGVGGGSGTCGINLKGTITTQGFTVPLNIDYCYTGLPGACDGGNSSLNQSVAGQGGIAGAANLVYSYSATCAPGALTVNLR